jgi:hypothetical protein
MAPITDMTTVKMTNGMGILLIKNAVRAAISPNTPCGVA